MQRCALDFAQQAQVRDKKRLFAQHLSNCSIPCQSRAGRLGSMSMSGRDNYLTRTVKDVLPGDGKETPCQKTMRRPADPEQGFALKSKAVSKSAVAPANHRK
jgi:hypothetical protein